VRPLLGGRVVTAGRITDRRGALWPVTGWWCDGCGMPLWWDDPSGLHPTCWRRDVAGLADADQGRLEDALAERLGAHPVDPVPSVSPGTWRRTGKPCALNTRTRGR